MQSKSVQMYFLRFGFWISLLLWMLKDIFSEFDPNATPLDWWQSLLQCNNDIFRCSYCCKYKLRHDFWTFHAVNHSIMEPYFWQLDFDVCIDIHLHFRYKIIRNVRYYIKSISYIVRLNSVWLYTLEFKMFYLYCITSLWEVNFNSSEVPVMIKLRPCLDIFYMMQ